MCIKTVADVSRDITIVDSLSDSTLDIDLMDLESINTIIASETMNALLTNEVTLGRTLSLKCRKPNVSFPPKKKLKLNSAAARDKLMVMRDSDVSSLDTESDSQSLLSSQE